MYFLIPPLVVAIFALYVKWRFNRILPSFHAILSGPDTPVRRQLLDLYPPNLYENAVDVKLPGALGSSRYYYFGKGDTTVVLVHGIGPPCAVFKKLATKLALSKRVLVYDLVGRGYSESSPLKHDDMLYIIQLSLIMQHAGLSKCHLIGFSAGGSIAISFTSYFPANVLSLTLIAPAGLMDELPVTGRIFAKPLLGELAIMTVASELMKNSSAKNFCIVPAAQRQFSNLSSESSVEEDVSYMLDLIRFQTDSHPGFKRSFLSTTRYFSLSNRDDIIKRLQIIGQETHQKMPVLVVWGTHDLLIPYHLSEHIKEAIPRAVLVPIDFASHNVVTENCQQVYEAIKQHLASI